MRMATTIFMLLLALGAGGHAWAGPKGPSDKARVVAANNAFALDLYRVVGKKSGNQIFSPASITTALAMAYAGARGETARQMAKALHFDLPPARLHRACGRVLVKLNAGGRKGGWQLHMASRLWGPEQKTFLKSFLGLVRRHYGAGLGKLDFAGDPVGAVGQINAWIAKNTAGKIEKLLGGDAVGPDTGLVIANAVFFKGLWVNPFHPGRTIEKAFYTSPTAPVNAMFMRRKGRYAYHKEEELQVLKMPYKGKALSMVLLLPSKIDGLAHLEEQLTPERLKGWLRRLRPQKVVVEVPRFKASASLDLGKLLVELGITQAFGMQADFSGMNGAKDLFISDGIHQALVEVNEKGTEAAAATALHMRRKNGGSGPEEFRADHPFMFLIRDDRDGQILFIGRLEKPSP